MTWFFCLKLLILFEIVHIYIIIIYTIINIYIIIYRIVDIYIFISIVISSFYTLFKTFTLLPLFPQNFHRFFAFIVTILTQHAFTMATLRSKPSTKTLATTTKIHSLCYYISKYFIVSLYSVRSQVTYVSFHIVSSAFLNQ